MTAPKRVRSVKNSQLKKVEKTSAILVPNKKVVKKNSALSKQIKTKNKVVTTPISTKKAKSSAKASVSTILKSSASVPTKSPGKALMILSPFRFPLDSKKIAIQTARYGGSMLVILGALLTLWHSNLFFSVPSSSQYAATATLSSQTLSGSFVARVTNHEVTFDINPAEPVSGDNVRVGINFEKVPSKAVLLGKNITTGKVYTFDKFSNLSQDTPEVFFNSKELEDGEYKFQVLAEYQDGNNNFYAVTISDTETRLVENYTANIENVVTESPAQEDEPPDENEIAVEEATPVSLETSYIEDFDGGVLSQVERLRIISSVADKVEVNLIDSHNASKLLGYAYKYTSSEWRFSLDTTNHAAGNYTLQILIIKDGSVLETLSNEVEIKAVEVEPEHEEDEESTVDEEIDANTNPEISIAVIGEVPLTGNATINVEIEQANYVELYVLSKNTATQKYLGLSNKVDADTWTYEWNTSLFPNAEHRIVAKIRTPYGVFTRQSEWTKTYNEITVTSSQNDLEYIKKVQEIQLEGIVNTKIATTYDTSPEQQLDKIVARELQATENPGQLADQKLDDLMSEFSAELESALQIFATSLRAGDEPSVELARSAVMAVMDHMLLAAKRRSFDEFLTNRLQENVRTLMQRIENDVNKLQKFITDRTGVDATTDTDNDGITDFDEITLYGTNPKVADSDGDGFTDGAEILSGHNPLDGTPEAAVIFESPKEVGVTREDILSVNSITTEKFETDDEAVDAQPVALITGKALPNSYVTLYIFSTPIVVTVRTESDGSWLYRFDKELPDGEHQVYVGITDNAGKIVAKSNPLSFIKEAQAYKQEETLAPGVVSEGTVVSKEPFVNPAVLIIASISVVSLGLILIMLGLHLEARPRLVLKENQDAPAT